jgi:hypothetical protein
MTETAYEPGRITIESTYIFVCSGCERRQDFEAPDYDTARSMARDAGWHQMVRPWKDLPGGWTCKNCYVDQWDREDARR